ncbi:4-hydroxyphenylacetate 3-hydroxylase family protein [Stenoxybacter acetivorans]|uniref:4-hydroxyphenylacetate 3-hydroxylase family protein n=1 Tax=Stenoxybacter acetivorans TaxID=422441 RepID=UPI00055AB1AC|nr:4-hydroxyphenylacetate 3-hydroxylase N-terminal domain-containing protein [Stenoxybacter acetivorans]
MKSTDINEMMTSQNYLESLKDDREVYIYGEKVPDITTHSAFKNGVHSISKLYDALHTPDSKEIMTSIDKDGYRTHRFFMPSYSNDDLLKAREAIAYWSRLTYGFMGRTPDYKAGFTATLQSESNLYNPFHDNAINWYRKITHNVMFLSHVLVNPPIGRGMAISDMRDIYLHVEKEIDSGIIVRGVKMVATGAVFSNAVFVAQNSATQYQTNREEDFALCFILPINAPNLKIICRRSYESSALSPFDNPLSSRFDENDSVLIFDGVFVPWENILIYRDIDRAKKFYSDSGFLNRYPLQSGTRVAVKLDFICGLLSKVLLSNGTASFRGVQVKLAEIFALRNLMWSLTESLCFNPEKRKDGSVVPRSEIATTVRYFGTQVMSQIKPIFNTILGGSPIMQPSSWLDIQNLDLNNLINQYFQGNNQKSNDRLKLIKLLWDALGSEFANRHEIYEYNYAGNNEQVRLDMLQQCKNSGVLEQCHSLVEKCMLDYSLSGWNDLGWSFDGICHDQR